MELAYLASRGCLMNGKAFGSKTTGSLILLATLFCLHPSANANYAGRVQKENSRVIRPLPEDQPTPILDSKLTAGAVNGPTIGARVADDSFVLKSDASAGSISSGLEAWNPWSGSASRPAPTPTFLAARALQAPPAQIPANVDYAAIEQAYAEAIPRPVVRCANSGNGVPMAQTLTNAAAAIASGASAPTVDYDNCLCGTAMPSDNCVRSRMTNFGVRTPTASQRLANGSRAPLPNYGRPGYSSPVAGQSLSAGAIPGLVVPGTEAVPLVLPSGVAIRAGAGYVFQIR